MHRKVFIVILLLLKLIPSFCQEGTTTREVVVTDSNDIPVDTIKIYRISTEALEFPIDYTARDSTIISLKNKKVYLFGKAQVKYSDIQLDADFIEVDMTYNTVFASGLPDSAGKVIGLPKFKDKSDEFTADRLTYNFKTKKGIIHGIFSKQNEGYIHSETTKKLADNSVCLKNGKFTTCDSPHPHFYVAMSKAKIIPDDKIVSGFAYLVIEDVPTPIGIPFGFFPNTKRRSSGILIPSYGEESTRGFFLREGGYYFGISDYMDLSMVGGIYSKGSWDLNAQSRYKKRYKFSGNLNMTYGNVVYGDKGAPDYSKRTQFKISWTHSQDPKAHPSRSFNASVNFSSVNQNKLAETNANNYLSNTTQSSINYRKKIENTPFSFSTTLSHSQNNRDSIYRFSLPDLNLNMEGVYPFRRKEVVGKLRWYENIQLKYSGTAQNKVVIKEKYLFSGAFVDSMRYGAKHSIPLSTTIKIFKYFSLSPSVNYNERWYFEKTPKYVDTLFYENTDSILQLRLLNKKPVEGFYRVYDYSYGVSLNTTLYGMFQFKNLKIKAIRHKMIPQVGFNYIPDFSKKHFGYYEINPIDSSQVYSLFPNSVYGMPGTTKSGTVSMSLANNLEMKVATKDTAGTKKIPIFEALNLSSGYNLIADSLNWSPVSLMARTTFFKVLTVNYNSSFDLYALNSKGTKMNQFVWENSDKFIRMTSANISTGFRLDNKIFDKNKKDKNSENERVATRASYDPYGYFDLPWSLNVSYGFTYSKPTFKSSINQTLTFSGSVALTKKWNIQFSSGYDIKNKEITYTNLSISRNLHCWSMALNLVPFGNNKSYTFHIGVSSGMFQDLKYDRTSSRYDNQNF